MTNRRSPVRYPGGKSRFLDVISAYFPDQIDEYREPFIGGGSVAFRVKRDYPDAKMWINDKFVPLYCFWKMLSQPKTAAELVRRLHTVLDKTARRPDALLLPDGMAADEKAAREHFEEVLDVIKKDSTASEMDQAVGFYYYNRCSFSGASGSRLTQQAWWRWADSRARITELLTWSGLMDGWRVTNLDYRDVLREEFTGNNPFVFMDPPYDISVDKLYGQNGSTHRGFDHQEMVRQSNALTARNIKTALTYNAEVEKLYAGWETLDAWPHNYSMVSTTEYRDKQKANLELIIANYETTRPAPPQAKAAAKKKRILPAGADQPPAA